MPLTGRLCPPPSAGVYLNGLPPPSKRWPDIAVPLLLRTLPMDARAAGTHRTGGRAHDNVTRACGWPDQLDRQSGGQAGRHPGGPRLVSGHGTESIVPVRGPAVVRMILETHARAPSRGAPAETAPGGGPLLPRRMRVIESGTPVPAWEFPADRTVDRPADGRRPPPEQHGTRSIVERCFSRS